MIGTMNLSFDTFWRLSVVQSRHFELLIIPRGLWMHISRAKRLISYGRQSDYQLRLAAVFGNASR